uniref:Uncharacterized protein n=1 Tax=Bactrocera latifrons TaxID=174628 RepID=A0A0K8UX35_BACLA
MAEGEIANDKSIKNADNFCITATNSSSINNAVLGEKLRKITALFFDLDNTLIPTRSGDLKAVKKVCVKEKGEQSRVGHKMIHAKSLEIFHCFVDNRRWELGGRVTSTRDIYA